MIVLLLLAATVFVAVYLDVGVRWNVDGMPAGFLRVPPESAWGLIYRWHLFLGPVEVYRRATWGRP